MTYDLHPEMRKRITRQGCGPSGQQWINTWADYTIRGRFSDGTERSWSVSDALNARCASAAEKASVSEHLDRLLAQTPRP